MIENHKYTSDEKLSCWGYGEWVEEPDEVFFTHEGLDCKVLRVYCQDGPNHIYGGHLNGYVRIPKDHIYYKKEYDDIECDVHGGLTYSRNELEGWWIGFDCAHHEDIVPSMDHFFIVSEEMLELRKIYPFSRVWERSYKNIKFVIEECKKLAEQMHNASTTNQERT
jgi:hypothetical protein